MLLSLYGERTKGKIEEKVRAEHTRERVRAEHTRERVTAEHTRERVSVPLVSLCSTCQREKV
jgi:hypothetical protein